MTSILQLLAQGAHTAREIARLLGMALTLVYEVLVHLEARGLAYVYVSKCGAFWECA